MQFNLFDWIREGVKRSVILGVSDAMEAIGSPDGDDGHAALRSFCRRPPSCRAGVARGGKRKRLGRSLRDFDGGEE